MKRTLTLAAAALALLPAVAVGGGTAAKAATPATSAPLVYLTNFDSTDRLIWKAGGDATGAQALDKVSGDDACSSSAAVAGWYGALRSFNPDVTRKQQVAGGEIPQPVATWAQAALPAANRSLVKVKVTWSARDVKDCADCIPAVYVGNGPAIRGGDFDLAGSLGSGWQQFQYEAEVDLSGSDGLFVALGWFGGNATIGLDCIAIRVEQARGGPATTEAGKAGKAAQVEAAAARQPGPSGDYYYNFERGLAPWSFGTDATYGLLQQISGENGCPDMLGNAFASISNMAGPLSGKDPLDSDMIPIPREPVMYMIAPFRAANAQVSHVELDWAAKNVDQCATCTQLVYVGNSPHPLATDFKRLGTDPGDKWANNHFETDLGTAAASSDAPIYIALGFQAARGGTPEGLHNLGIDCVSVRIHPPDN